VAGGACRRQSLGTAGRMAARPQVTDWRDTDIIGRHPAGG
jgi:hypothetical protein